MVYGGVFAPACVLCYGTDHDSEPLPPLSGICLPPRPVQSRQEEYRGFGTAAQGLRRDLFPLPSAGYDQLTERRFEFIPLWGFFVFLFYAMRRVNCHRCRTVVVEEVPWGDGKRSLTKAYMLYLAR